MGQLCSRVDSSSSFSVAVIDEPFGAYIRRACPGLQRPFRAAWFAQTGFLQSALAGIYHKLPDEYLPFDREVLALPDGGEVAIDWMRTSRPSTVVMFLPKHRRRWEYHHPPHGSHLSQIFQHRVRDGHIPKHRRTSPQKSKAPWFGILFDR